MECSVPEEKLALYLSFLLFSKEGQPDRITWKVLHLCKQRRLISKLDTHLVLDLLTCGGRCVQNLGRVPGIECMVLQEAFQAQKGKDSPFSVLVFDTKGRQRNPF